MKQRIKAILDTDVENLLKRTVQFEQLLKGELFCVNCGNIITIDNIGLMLPMKTPEGLKVSFYCDDIDCLKKHYEKDGR